MNAKDEKQMNFQTSTVVKIVEFDPVSLAEKMLRISNSELKSYNKIIPKNSSHEYTDAKRFAFNQPFLKQRDLLLKSLETMSLI